MCISPNELAKIFGLPEVPAISKRYNIAPSQGVGTVLYESGGTGRIYKEMKWGLIPSWSKDLSIGYKLINARSETVDEKPAFRDSFKRSRCLIPADGFYEWRKADKQPYYFRLKEDIPFAFAGLCDKWNAPDGNVIESCTILTTSANNLILPVHNRMPVILYPKDYEIWMDRSVYQTDKLKHLLQPFPADQMVSYPVSKLVNSPKIDVPDCITPSKTERYNVE